MKRQIVLVLLTILGGLVTADECRCKNQKYDAQTTGLIFLLKSITVQTSCIPPEVIFEYDNGDTNCVNPFLAVDALLQSIKALPVADAHSLEELTLALGVTKNIFTQAIPDGVFTEHRL